MSLENKIILVTGASRGLGAATAKLCALHGAQVVATARTQGALEELDDTLRRDGKTLTLLPLDLNEGQKLDQLGISILQRFGRLDGFVHCAAVLDPLSPITHTDPSVLDRALKLNVMATHRLIRALDPALKAAPGARAIFVLDPVAEANRPFFGVYAASKAAQKAIVMAYAAEIQSTPIGITFVRPPPISTRLRQTAYPGEPKHLQAEPIAVAEVLLPLLIKKEKSSGNTVDLRQILTN